MGVHDWLQDIIRIIIIICVLRVCVDGTARRTTVWFPGADSAITAQVLGASERTGLSEKRQRTGPSPANSSCLASAVYQPCYRTAHTAEGASWGQSRIHLTQESTHSHTHTVSFSRLLCPCVTHSQMHSLTSCVVQQTFLVRKSRTSQKNVLCVRLADDSVPSFVQQFGIREEQPSKTAASFYLAKCWVKPVHRQIQILSCQLDAMQNYNWHKR